MVSSYQISFFAAVVVIREKKGTKARVREVTLASLLLISNSNNNK
jgi:hypothetical protein